VPGSRSVTSALKLLQRNRAGRRAVKGAKKRGSCAVRIFEVRSDGSCVYLHPTKGFRYQRPWAPV
jgi:hypothetical protein